MQISDPFHNRHPGRISGERKKEKDLPTYLSDGHLFSHLGFAANTSIPGGGSAGASLALKDLPELQALVGGSSSEHLPIRAEAAVKDTSLMGGDLHVTHQSGVAPDAKG